MYARVSGSVDQTTCLTPAAFAAFAMARACARSRSTETYSQNAVTKNAPCAPSSAFSTLASSSRSAVTISAPRAASAFAGSEPGLRVTARTANSPPGSSRMARARPPPCCPVAPTTAMIFFSVIARGSLCRSRPACSGRSRNESASALTSGAWLDDVPCTSIGSGEKNGVDVLSTLRGRLVDGARQWRRMEILEDWMECRSRVMGWMDGFDWPLSLSCLRRRIEVA